MSILERIALHAVYLPLCLGIVVAVICRINLMTAKRNKLSWWVMYAAFAMYAGGELMDVLTLQKWMATHELIGLVGIALNLALTSRHWRAGPPPITCKPGCAP